jgi:peptide/nickel transport system ATP-binding protein
MRQRIMIAIALSCDPKLLIADEPTTALDVTIQAQILDLLRESKRERNMSLMLITHDLGVVAEMADYVVVMYAGKVIEEAPVKEIFKNPRHPYTRGLLKAKPIIGQRSERLYNIPGRVPNPIGLPDHCHFADRCEHRMEICVTKQPELNADEYGHKIACWLHEGEKA